MSKINRRHFLSSVAIAPFIAPSSYLFASEEDAVFRHGVASGDPASDSVVLWTRVTTIRPEVIVRWELAADEEFNQLVASGEALATPYRDYTVKTIAAGLMPGKTYYYRFHTLGQTSPEGRTRTLPAGRLNNLGIALTSCTNYPFGFFNAYDAIARDEKVEFVLHTGDYIYEYGADGWGADVGKKIGREHYPTHEIVTLDDYRKRHAQYKSDAGSIAMHAKHPLICLWDDHESANNPWIGGAQNHQPNEGMWRDRRYASIQAYYEWMPVRDPAPGSRRVDLWRHYSFGDLASLVTLETRHTARAKQIDYNDYLDSIKSDADSRRFKNEVLAKPGRAMISPEMEQFLSIALKQSIDEKQPWRLLGNASPMAKMPVPDVGSEGIKLPAGSAVPGTTADLLWKGQYNLPFYLDTWDGYHWARERFYDLCHQAGATDLLVLTGDSHSFWSNNLYKDNGMKMGVEIGTAGISSPGDFIESGFGEAQSKKLDQLFMEGVAEVRWTDNMHQGYVRMDITPEAAEANFIGMSTVLKPEYHASVLRKETIVRSKDSIGFG